MLYYLGKGTEFKKAECKEYKTIEGALKAAAKDENLVVWDESGKIVGSLTDNVPDGALQENPDGSVPTFDENGNPVGAVDAETVAGATTHNDEETDEQNTSQDGTENHENASNEDEGVNMPPQTENGENEANTERENPDEQQPDKIIPQGEMRVTVICDGSLNLRRSASWSPDNICGRATRGQKYYVRAIHTVDGKKMVETIDGLYLSGDSAYVQFEQL